MTIKIVAHGDSITVGFGLPDPSFRFTSLLQTQLNTNGKGVDLASQGTNGAGFHDYGSNLSLITDALSNVDNQLAPNAILLLMAGINDLFYAGAGSAAVTYSFFQTYILARLAAGWTAKSIVVCNILPASTVAWSDVDAYNVLLTSSGKPTYGYSLVRIDQNAHIGVQNANLDTTYYQGDGVHPNSLGHIEIKNEIYPAISQLITSQILMAQACM